MSTDHEISVTSAILM